MSQTKEPAQPKEAAPLSFEEYLAQKRHLVYANKGTSMMPLLRQDRDLFVIEEKKERLARYDVALYRRGRRYVLHRVLHVLPDGYLICGDHCIKREHVKEEQVIGVMSAFIRDGKETPVTDRRYRIYVHLWCDFYPVRAAILMGEALLHKAGRRLLHKKGEAA